MDQNYADLVASRLMAERTADRLDRLDAAAKLGRQIALIKRAMSFLRS